jgi:hypothetical protein
MQLFDSAKVYLFVFCMLVLSAIGKLHQLIRGALHSGAAGLTAKTFLLALITFFMAAYLPILLRKISNRIEQMGIVLTEVLCVLWLGELLTDLGARWADIPHGPSISAVANCIVAVLAGVRAVQVLRHREQSQEEE